jgi:dCMP deaminase
VGAILVSNNNVISVAYNGPSTGQPHCTGKSCPTSDGCIRALHAEKNAIDRCILPRPFHDVHVDLYTTESPCARCAELIIASGIRAVYYQNEYRLREPIDALIDAGVAVFRLTPSGYTVNCLTEEFEG